MTCGVLHTLGAFGGDMRGPTRYNAKGMYENHKVVEMVKDYLRSMNCDPKAQHPLPSMDELKPWTNTRSQIQRAMIEDSYKGGPWFFKTVKGCHFWPIFHEAFPNALWVIVRRDRDSNADSLLRTGFMNAFQTKQEWLAYIDRHEARFEEIAATCRYVEVDTDAVVGGNFEDLEEVATQVGLKWNEQAVTEFVDPKLTKVA